MTETVLLLGGNIGNTISYFRKAKALVSQDIGEIKRESSVYETEPWGFSAEQNFLNQVVIVESSHSPLDLLRMALKIEQSLGRERISTKGYSSRIIDIDVLFIESKVIETVELTVPHPKIQERKFVLEPLNELLPDFIHPRLNSSIQELLVNLKDKTIIKKLAPHEYSV